MKNNDYRVILASSLMHNVDTINSIWVIFTKFMIINNWTVTYIQIKILYNYLQ